MTAANPTSRERPPAFSPEPFRAKSHPFCVVCSQANHHGFQLEFRRQPDGSVRATFQGNRFLQGYPGCLHGGIIASLLDGAMTNCLFARGIQGVTAELKVRYRQPVLASDPVVVRGWLREAHGRLQLLGADLSQDGRVKVTALGKFMKNDE